MKLNFNNEKLILDSNDLTTVNNKKLINIINKYDITKLLLLYNNFNYLIKIDNLTKIEIYNEFMENYDLVSDYDNNLYSSLIKLDNKKGKWKLTTSNNFYNGDLITTDYKNVIVIMKLLKIINLII